MRRTFLSMFVMMGALFIWSNQAFACACCGSWKVTNVAQWDVLNMRAGPGAKFRIVGTIPPESACIIRHNKCRRNWCRVSYADYTGWVNIRYLEWLP